MRAVVYVGTLALGAALALVCGCTSYAPTAITQPQSHEMGDESPYVVYYDSLPGDATLVATDYEFD